MTDQPESGPREWWAMESHLDKGPPIIVSNERAEKYGHKDVNWHYFKVVEHSALQRAEDTILVNQGQVQSLRAQVEKAETRIAELEASPAIVVDGDLLNVLGIANARSTAAEVRVKELEQANLILAQSNMALLDDLQVIRIRLARTERERDAYMRAKAENDERFMLERDNSIARIAQLQVTCGDLTDRSDTLKAKLKEVDKDPHSAEVHVKELIADNDRLRAALERIVSGEVEFDEGSLAIEIAREALK